MAAGKAPEQKWTRGYYKLYHDSVLQADNGVDLDFLVGASGSESSAKATDGISGAK